MGFKIDSHRSSSDVLEIPRAKSCGLSCSKVKKEFDLDLPSLDDVINICVAEDRNLDLTNK